MSGGRAERWRIAGMGGVVLLFHATGWGMLALMAATATGATAATLTVGVGATAYALGMRHAFDADHIAAIDNTTRALISRGRRPVSVGFFFSLGHSTVVFALAVLLAVGIRSVAGSVEDQGSAFHALASVTGTLVSGVFLLLIAVVNIVTLAGTMRVAAALRRGEASESDVDALLTGGGLLTRLFGRHLRAISRSWQVYPVGLLFGLGFDTATEIALLVLAGSSAAAGLPWYAVVTLPVLFAAGMTLLDSTDGVVMMHAYRWALGRPKRRILYNVAVTLLSVVVAVVVGGIEIVVLLGDYVGWHGPFMAWLGDLDMTTVGYVVVAAFVVTWAGAVAVSKISRSDDASRNPRHVGGGAAHASSMTNQMPTAVTSPSLR